MLCAHITHIAEHHGGGQGLVSAVTGYCYDIIVQECRLEENIMAPLVFNDNTVWAPFLLFLWISGQCNEMGATKYAITRASTSFFVFFFFLNITPA